MSKHAMPRTRSAGIAVARAACVAALAVASLMASPAAKAGQVCPGATTSTTGNSTTCTYAYTGAQQAFVVPAGVTSVSVTAAGGSGGTGGSLTGGTPGSGGLAGTASGTITVTPGQTLYVEVGGAGTSGAAGGTAGWPDGATGATAQTRGGGGGGSSDVRTTSFLVPGSVSSRQVIAAGGGGGGGAPNASVCSDATLPAGGDGGSAGLPGGTGAACNTAAGGGAGQPGAAAAGGAGGAGGTGGTTSGVTGTSGNLGGGSAGGGPGGGAGGISGGGGGGGGRYGGGGGGGASYGPPDTGSGGGGGGGSSLGTTTGMATAPGNGSVAITYTSLPSITTPSPLPGGRVGHRYRATLTATGGITPYTWRRSAGTLPRGLSLSTGGTISGTPARRGTSHFTIAVTDAGNDSATQAYTLTVSQPRATLRIYLKHRGIFRPHRIGRYMIRVTNRGGASARDRTRVVLGLPDQLAVTRGGRGARWRCTKHTHSVFCFRDAPIRAHGRTTIIVTVRVNAKRGTTLFATASVRPPDNFSTDRVVIH